MEGVSTLSLPSTMLLRHRHLCPHTSGYFSDHILRITSQKWNFWDKLHMCFSRMRPPERCISVPFHWKCLRMLGSPHCIKCRLQKKKKKSRGIQDEFTECHWISERSSYFTPSCRHLFRPRRWGTCSSETPSSLGHFQSEPSQTLRNEASWLRKLFSISRFGVTKRPAPDQMLPFLCKIKRCKKIPGADCQALS